MASSRPRGFAHWRPQQKTQDLLDQVNVVLATYTDELPITARQCFYRLVATVGFEKSERGYKRLLETLNRARRAGLVPMDAIRDDGATAPVRTDSRAVRSFSAAAATGRRTSSWICSRSSPAIWSCCAKQPAWSLS